MSRPRKLVPSYRRHKASGQGVVTINGRDHYLGPYGSKASEREYDRLITEWLAAGRSASFGTGVCDFTVVELAADYVEFAKVYYGTGASSEYHHIIRLVRLLKGFYGRMPAGEFGVVQFKAVRQKLIENSCARKYINASMDRIERMFRWGAAEGKIPPNGPQAIAMVAGLRKGKTTAPETEPVAPVHDSVVASTLPHLPEVVGDMVRFHRLTGCRPAEVCILRPCDVDRSDEVWVYRPHKHKTEHHHRDRVVPIGPKAQEVLLKYLDREAEMYCFRPCDSMRKYLDAKHAARKTPMSCGNKPGSNRRRKPRRTPGEHYDTGAYRRAIARACEKAFPHPVHGNTPMRKLVSEALAEVRKWQSDHRWAPNQLRHTAATEIRKKFGLEYAQVVLGHSDANVTQIYAECDLAKGKAVAKAIG